MFLRLQEGGRGLPALSSSAEPWIPWIKEMVKLGRQAQHLQPVVGPATVEERRGEAGAIQAQLGEETGHILGHHTGVALVRRVGLSSPQSLHKSEHVCFCAGLFIVLGKT